MKQPRKGVGRSTVAPSVAVGPTGNCVLLLEKGKGDRHRVSDLVRHDDRSLRTLVACQVKQASQLADTVGLLDEKAARAEVARSNPHPEPDNH